MCGKKRFPVSLAALSLCLLLFAPHAHAKGSSAPVDFSGAWEAGDISKGADRLIIRRERMILIEGDKTIHGGLEYKPEGWLYRVDFVNGSPEERVEEIDLRKDGEELVFVRDGKKKRYRKMVSNVAFPPARRKGFSYSLPEGWISNVGLFARRVGKEPGDYDTDQLVHFYEAGVKNPTESMTLRLLDKPFEEVLKGVEEKMKNKKLSSSRKKLTIGDLSGYLFDNSTPLGESRISARVYILKWDKRKTFVLAAPTLLPYFPFDLDKDCRAVLGSLEL